MKIKFLKYLIFTLTILISLIVYLSIIGIETDKFNKKIKSKLFEINNNLDLDIKKIKFTLDPLNFRISVKTVGPSLYYSNNYLDLEYIKTQVSLISILKNKFVSSNLKIVTKSLLISDLVKFVRAIDNKTELFILEKITKKGHVILDLNLNFDESGSIQDDYNIKGILKDGKIKILKDINFEKINFLFNLKKNNFLFEEINFTTHKVNFFSNTLKIKKKKNSFLFNGEINNRKSTFTQKFSKLIKLNLSDFNFKNINFASKNNFSFELDNKFKIKNLILQSDVDIAQFEYIAGDPILDYFPELNKIILLKDHKLKLNYKKEQLSIEGEGKIQLEEKFNKIQYFISKNKDNLNITSDLIIEKINLKKQEFLKNFFPLMNDQIKLKNHKLNINYKNKNLLLSGNGKIKIDKEFDNINYFISKKNDKFNFDISLDLIKTNFKIEKLNFQKNNKAISKFKIKGEFENNKFLNLNNFIFLENDNKIKISNLLLDKDYLIVQIDKADFNYKDIENKKNKFSIKKIKKNQYELKGLSLNANSLITNLLTDENNNIIIQNNVSLNLILNKVFIDEEYFVKDLRGQLFINDNNVTDTNISAVFENRGNINFTISTDNGKKITTLNSTWAKPLVNRYKFIKGFDEGYLDFYSSKKEDLSKSKLIIDNFKVKEIPVLAKLLALASLQGIADLLTGEGIRFTDFEMNFTNKNKLMTIEELYAIGPAISILIEGYIEKDNIISLRGTLVPATTINRSIASIPLIGDLLIGKKAGEGVFGVSFKVKGPPKKLETTVNPIKTLTPRFITRTLEKIKKN